MDSDMVEIAPPVFAWGSTTLEIQKEGFSGDECSPAISKFACRKVMESQQGGLEIVPLTP